MYWSNVDSKIMNISDLYRYSEFPHMTPTIPEGYNSDPFQPTPVMFMGSCDLDGPIKNTNNSWARLLHAHLVREEGKPIPYIALGKVSSGFRAFPRRLLTYCEKYGPPKVLYMGMPRQVNIEIPLSTGQIVGVSNRESYPHWLFNRGKIIKEDLELLLGAVNFCKSQINNDLYQLYLFEETAAFMKIICTYYDIELKWTLNLSAAAIMYYDKFLMQFLEASPFMKRGFVGVATAKDFAFEGSMGDLGHVELCNRFINPDTDYDRTIQTLKANVEFAEAASSIAHRALS